MRKPSCIGGDWAPRGHPKTPFSRLSVASRDRSTAKPWYRWTLWLFQGALTLGPAGLALGLRRRWIVALLLGALALGPVGPAFAQIPPLIRYQGTLTDSDGALLDGSYDLTFRFYDAATGGAKMWEETQTGVSVASGAFSVLLGQVAPLNLAFDIDCWLAVSVNRGAELSPRTRVASVPNAYRADRSERLADSPALWPQNFVRNGSFERWTNGTSGIPAEWQVGGVSVTRETRSLKDGNASVSLTTTEYGWIRQIATSQVGGMEYARGRTFTFGAWVKTSVADQARLYAWDSGGPSTSSGYHTGSGQWEWLSLTHTVANSEGATDFVVFLLLDLPGAAQMDSAMLAEGSLPTPVAFSPNPQDGKGGPIRVLGESVGIGREPQYTLDVKGYVRASGYFTGDLLFQKEGQLLWRMYEEPDGLYLESLLTHRHYRLVLEPVREPRPAWTPPQPEPSTSADLEARFEQMIQAELEKKKKGK